jgi:hypothetical protein
MPGACSVVPVCAVDIGIASSGAVLAGTGVAVSGEDARSGMPGACGVVPVCAVDTGIASSIAVLAGTSVAVIGAGAETDLAADGFAVRNAEPAGSLDEAAGV